MDQLNLARKFAKDLKNRCGKEISSIILFGSAAKGKETKGSDIDLLIVSKEHLSKEMDKSISIVLKEGVVPEIINMNDKEFRRMRRIGSPLYRIISSEGVQIG